MIPFSLQRPKTPHFFASLCAVSPPWLGAKLPFVLIKNKRLLIRPHLFHLEMSLGQL
jgi:hypothetical protein